MEEFLVRSNGKEVFFDAIARANWQRAQAQGPAELRALLAALRGPPARGG